jgi:hypothetical protein
LVSKHSEEIITIQQQNNMSRAAVPDKPALCLQEAIDCHSCTASTARELARACPSLPNKLISRLFVQIHTHAACARMHANFTRAYIEAGELAAASGKKSMGAPQPMARTAVA